MIATRLRQLGMLLFSMLLCAVAFSLPTELALTGKRWYIYDIPRFFEEDFFETKKVVYTPKK